MTKSCKSLSTLVGQQVLDYFTQMQAEVDNDHIIFRFESSMEFGAAERDLLNQVCLRMAYERGPELLPLYMSGEEAIFLEDFPELGCFRDIVFMFKAIQVGSFAQPTLEPACTDFEF